ncbi:hypothetical protein COY26_01500 [Candidatus Woesearchaeota archaeon CG_4_10_14_0_2_um_filter_33_10]|nr:MAG: hypothetical protein AUJ83_02990 [Candidatus Woesearchaeota archaeon CG1_02_33_12]PIZ53582.1 MAG: hypothetical protein COY26_01500 [Candidatus Woesearchaeota archaeon CG_4_10_14_0_2_um_filter_33_10]
MNNKLVIPLIILALIGLYFIGSNITGYVISQSCCYPPDCEPENMCDFTEQHQKYSASLDIANHTVYIGEILILVSILTYILMYRKDKNS